MENNYCDPHSVLEISRNPEESMLYVHALLIRTQFTFRQRRLSLGRCEHKLDAPCSLHTDHLLPTCNYGRFHRTLKSVARSWQYVCCTHVACRSAILDLISRCRRVLIDRYCKNRYWKHRYWKECVQNNYSDHTIKVQTLFL